MINTMDDTWSKGSITMSIWDKERAAEIDKRYPNIGPWNPSDGLTKERLSWLQEMVELDHEATNGGFMHLAVPTVMMLEILRLAQKSPGNELFNLHYSWCRKNRESPVGDSPFYLALVELKEIV